LKRLVMMLALIVLVWASASRVGPAFSHAPEVRSVVPRDVDGATHLNITVWHDIETLLHYVDTIEVTWGTNITSLTMDPKPLRPDGTFTIEYNMGPVSGPPPNHRQGQLHNNRVFRINTVEWADSRVLHPGFAANIHNWHSGFNDTAQARAATASTVATHTERCARTSVTADCSVRACNIFCYPKY
jgi:hypothetical protein